MDEFLTDAELYAIEGQRELDEALTAEEIEAQDDYARQCGWALEQRA